MPWTHNLAIVYRIEIVTSYHTSSAPSCSTLCCEVFSTDDEGCEDATELPLQNVIANENEQLKKETKNDHTRAVQHVAVLNCDQYVCKRVDASVNICRLASPPTYPQENVVFLVADFVIGYINFH